MRIDSHLIEESRLALLSRREKDCLRLVYGRRTTKEIAIELGLSPGTVFSYIGDAQTKLGARNRRQAAEWLHDAEHDPIGFGANSDGVAATIVSGSFRREEWWRVWRRHLPIRRKGAAHNDLSILARAIWPIVFAVAFAIGFGMLAVGAEVISRFLQPGWR